MARTNLRNILRGQNLFVEGVGNIGKVGDIEPPKVEFEMAEDGNMSRKVDTGLLKPMEAKFTVYDINPVLYAAVGKRLGDTASFVVKASVVEGNKHKQVLFEATGQVESQEQEGTKEAGKETGMVFNVAVTAYRLEIDGTQVYDIDVDRYICKIDGKDHMDTLRKQIM